MGWRKDMRHFLGVGHGGLILVSCIGIGGFVSQCNERLLCTQVYVHRQTKMIGNRDVSW